ncbi:hemerythrin [Clostridia bacterium]|nr:hemerythrin [Clostridia bacterium]
MLWNDSLATGVALIDEQHKELFRAIDMLMDTSQKGRIPEVLKFLSDYVDKHFADEQKLHASSVYPKAAVHRTYHENFVRTLRENVAKYNANPNIPAILAINKMASNWLTEHIMVHDMEFSRYYKSR